MRLTLAELAHMAKAWGMTQGHKSFYISIPSVSKALAVKITKKIISEILWGEKKMFR